MTKKPFLITIDTEGDNLWGRNAGAATVRNAEHLPRFQELCGRFGFKPTHLTNREMARAPDRRGGTDYRHVPSAPYHMDGADTAKPAAAAPAP